ncbi:MAG: hypothetical protein ACREQY_03980 [Candidatus Binatia bacterium]
MSVAVPAADSVTSREGAAEDERELLATTLGEAIDCFRRTWLR